MSGINIKSIYVGLPRTLPQRTPLTYNQRITFEVSFQTLSEKTKIDYSNQPRLNSKFKETYISTSKMPPYVGASASFNPFILNHIGAEVATVTIQGMVTELGAPVLNRKVLVVLMTTFGDVVEKVYTDLEGNFVFYEIPQNLSLMAVAIDNTYKYNATILSKILTVDNGE